MVKWACCAGLICRSDVGCHQWTPSEHLCLSVFICGLRIFFVGVIDSLSAGYRFLGRRIGLLAIPVLLDMWLRFGPQLSVAPLFTWLADLYRSLAAVEGLSPEMATLVGQLADSLGQMGESSNLFSLLVNNSLLHVPSAVVAIGPAPGATVQTIANPVVAVGLALAFWILGILIGVVYLTLLARNLPLGNSPRPLAWAEGAKLVVVHWGMIVAFVALTALALVAISLPVTFGIALVSLLSPVLGSGLGFLLSGLIFLVLFYLYFVTVAIVMDNATLPTAVLGSARLVRRNFWPTVGFIVLTNLISIGFLLLVNQVAALASFGANVAILVNAYIGTGLAMAWLVFYRTRVLRMHEEMAAALQGS